MIGKTISHYEILEKLGEGGMGVVYKALDTKLDRHVAIKFLPPHLKSNAQAKKRFVHEAKAASALNHANIAVVHDINETPEGQMFIVMAYYEGQTLKDKIASGALDIDEAVAIVSQIASGLSAAHERGILHRDIKPANVLLGTDGQAKLADFGLAKLTGQTKVTKTGTTVGTVAYMSPEQASGREVDHRSDVFSLGVVLYELLTGRLPFRGDHEAAVLYGILNSDPEPLAAQTPDLPPGLEQVVEKALAKDPGARYRTAADMQADLQHIRTSAGRSQTTRWRSQWNKRLVALIVVALAAVVVYAGVKRFWFSEDVPRTTGDTEVVTIAVLPFVNVSSDPEQEYFSDGLTEELMNVLSRIPELRVTGRTSSFSFKGRNEDLRTIGQKLGVAHILEGSVRKAGSALKISAQLIDAENGFQLWSETYDQTLDDIFTVQADIARSVAHRLRLTLLGDGANGGKPRNAEAHDLVMRARFVLREERTKEGTRRARELVERAQRIDPDYAPAWTQMGVVLDRERMSAHTIELQHGILDSARVVYEKALALDPGFALAHSGMALNVHLESWEFEAAQRSMERALELEPTNPSIVGGAAYLYWALGRFDEAIALGEQWLKAEPLFRGAYINLAQAYRAAGRLDDAVAIIEKGQELWPDELSGVLARVYLSAGRVAEARAAWIRAVEASGVGEPMRLFYDALIEHSAGNPTASDSALAQFQNGYGASYPTSCARIHAWRRETDVAFGWLDKAYAARDPALAYLKRYVEFQELYSDPRWAVLVEKMGLPRD